MDEIDAIPVSVVALDQSTPLVGTPLVRQKTATRTVRTQKEINDADQAELAALELIPMGSLTEHRRTQLNAKIAKIKAKVNLYAFKIASQTEAVQSKKTRMSFESEDVMRLLDARRLQDHQFTDKAINNAETKKNLVDESFNQGFVALPKGGYGVPFRAADNIVLNTITFSKTWNCSIGIAKSCCR